MTSFRATNPEKEDDFGAGEGCISDLKRQQNGLVNIYRRGIVGLKEAKGHWDAAVPYSRAQSVRLR
jgi:hypothetical protein